MAAPPPPPYQWHLDVLLNDERTPKDSGTVTFYTWLKKIENISPYLDCDSAQKKKEPDSAQKKKEPGAHKRKELARTEILSKYQEETGCYFYLLQVPLQLPKPTVGAALTLEDAVHYSKDLFYSASRYAIKQKKADDNKAEVTNKNPRDDRSSHSISGYFPKKKQRVSEEGAAAPKPDSKGAGVAKNKSDPKPDSKLPADLCDSKGAGVSKNQSDPKPADSKLPAVIDLCDSSEDLDPSDTTPTPSDTTPTPEISPALADVLKRITPSTASSSANSNNPVQGDFAKPLVASPDDSFAKLAEYFYETNSAKEFANDDAIRHFLNGQKYFSVKLHFEALRTFLILGTHPAATISTTKQVPTARKKEPSAKKTLCFDKLLGPETVPSAPVPSDKTLGPETVLPSAPVPSAATPSVVPTPQITEVFNNVCRQLVDTERSDSKEKQNGGTNLILLNVGDPSLSTVSSMSSMFVSSQPLSSVLARTASNLDNKSDLFPPLMPCNADGSPHYISKYVPSRVFDKNYTHCIHASILGAAVESGYYGKQRMAVVRFALETVPSEEKGDVFYQLYYEKSMPVLHKPPGDLDQQFVLSASSLLRLPEEKVITIPQLPLLEYKRQALSLDKVIVSRYEFGHKIEYKVDQQMMDPIGEFWYALKKISDDTAAKEEEAKMMSKLFHDWKPTPASSVIVVSHAEIHGKPVISGFVHGEMMSYDPKQTWFVKELTEEESKEKVTETETEDKATSKTSTYKNVYTYFHNWFVHDQDQVSFPIRSVSLEEKKRQGAVCRDRFTSFQAASFAQMLSDQHRLLLEFRKLAMEKTGEDFCPRNGWEQWPPVPHGDRMYGWMICVLCICTSSSPDDKCKEIVQEILNRFPNPFEICLHPKRAMDFLCSKVKGYKFSGDPEAGRMKTGMNYGFIKAMFIVIMSKQIVIYWAKNNVEEWVDEREDYLEHYCQAKTKTNPGTYLRPLPVHWVTYAEKMETPLLPTEFDFEFFMGLRGIGIKMANLIAEAVFLKPYGPAVDRHLIRLLVECNLIPASASDKYIHDFCRSAYASHAPTVFTLMNEVPGMIAQVAQKKTFKKPIKNMSEVDEMRMELYKKLIGAAAANGHGKLFPFFLRSYMKYPLKAAPTGRPTTSGAKAKDGN